jgi:hypothetical protein
MQQKPTSLCVLMQHNIILCIYIEIKARLQESTGPMEKHGVIDDTRDVDDDDDDDDVFAQPIRRGSLTAKACSVDNCKRPRAKNRAYCEVHCRSY